jgi:hypothetical protein
VRELIARELGVEVGEDTIGRYLRMRAWGMSAQTPMRRGCEQSDEAVRRWLEVDYQAIVQQARRERAEILWLDESGLRSDHAAGRTWAPVGQTPVTQGTGQRFQASLIAAISNTGALRFRVFDERFTGPVFVDFLKRLVKDNAGRKIRLILDGHPTHRARVVRDWVAAHRALIELHFRPGYSPSSTPPSASTKTSRPTPWASAARAPSRSSKQRPKLPALLPAPPRQGRPLLPRAPRPLAAA